MGGTALDTQDTPPWEVGTRIATAATDWLASLDAGQRAVGAMRKPGADAESEADALAAHYAGHHRG